MSFVGPPFEHDLFISYAHADADRVGDADIKAWCQDFAKDLRTALRRFPEFTPFYLYLDESPREGERLDETAGLTPSLRKAAASSALLCAMMSPWYLKSKSTGNGFDHIVVSYRSAENDHVAGACFWAWRAGIAHC
jgi:hypothetical protein